MNFEIARSDFPIVPIFQSVSARFPIAIAASFWDKAEMNFASGSNTDLPSI